MQNAQYPDKLSSYLLAWLGLPTAREQRRYLEDHNNLLDLQSDTVLHALLAHLSYPYAFKNAPLGASASPSFECKQISEGSDQTQQVHNARLLLQDIHGRGGTTQAIREAYINMYGGFVLDLPPWLEEVEQRLTDLLNENRFEETAEARVAILQDALAHLQGDTVVAPELLATLRRELADAWQKHQRTDRAQAIEAIISICEDILQVYTATRYPHQYANVQNTLGNAYADRIAGERRENLERAIACFQETLRVQTLEAFPFQYAKAQNNLGITYVDRIAGERRENLERAIACFQETLRVQTLEAFPFQYATTQNNLGLAYWYRIVGERQENLEHAIVCFHEALRVLTFETFPFAYAMTQNNLGLVYRERTVGERPKNLEQAITCFQEALHIWTLDTMPFYYAEGQNNLGQAYRERTVGESPKNLEQAITCFQEALRIWTLDAFPIQYAAVQHDLGRTYVQRMEGERQENLKQAIASYQQALRVYTLDAFPRESRDVRLSFAEAEAQRGHWSMVQSAYRAALEAEDLLIIVGAGTIGRNAILKEGRDAAMRSGYALYRMGCIAEAAVTIERGRARGLAEAMALDEADPTLIVDEGRRIYYRSAREALIRTQAALHEPFVQELDEDARRSLDLKYTAEYRKAKSDFDKIVEEIRTAHDPPDFLNAPLDASTILRAAEHIGPGHVLVYLVATPWGGVAIAALGTESSAARFIALDLPNLTETFVNTLCETRLDDSSRHVIGGFVPAQIGESGRLFQQWEGDTFFAKIKALRGACRKTKQESTLEQATRDALACVPFAQLAKQPLAQLKCEDQDLLNATLDHHFLRRELAHCLDRLGELVLQPMMTWLCEQGATSLTLIPCGHLAVFPLVAVPLSDGCSVGNMLPTTVTPSASSLLHVSTIRHIQTGVFALGDPQNNLPWSEAEALTLATLARRSQLPAEAHVKQQATRERLLTALSSRWLVDASCHGTFEPQDFLRSALRLAKGERITMSEMLSHQADLRGLRLLILSACQTALLDLQGARDEAYSLATAMVQSGARAVLATQWAVDDQATYLLIVRFVQEWLPRLEQEPPAAALARSQSWLRSVTNAELAIWQSTMEVPTSEKRLPGVGQLEQVTIRKAVTKWQLIPVRRRYVRYLEEDAQLAIRFGAEQDVLSAQPYADPYYWAGFQIIGW